MHANFAVIKTFCIYETEQQSSKFIIIVIDIIGKRKFYFHVQH